MPELSSGPWSWAPHTALPLGTWVRSCPHPWCWSSTTAAQLPPMVLYISGPSLLLPADQDLLADSRTAMFSGGTGTCLLLTGDLVMTLQQCPLLRSTGADCTTSEGMSNQEKKADAKPLNQGHNRSSWLASSLNPPTPSPEGKGHFPPPPLQPQAGSAAGCAPSLGGKHGERHFSCYSTGCAFHFPCLRALRVVVGCSRWWVIFF